MAINDPANKLAEKINDIVDSKIRKKTKKSPVIKSGKVVKIDENGMPWVSVSGSDEATPVNGEALANVKPGDLVSVNIENGKCNILGNPDDPSIGSNEAKNVSNQEIKIAVEQEGTIGRAIDVENNKTIDKLDGMISDQLVPIEETIDDLGLKSNEDIRILKNKTIYSTNIANEAKEVSEATNQHFWHDDYGAHVTEITQEEWKSSPIGFNSLFNSLGLLLRKALNYIAAFTHSSVTFYDGEGNESGNITASFGKDGATVGQEGNPRLLISSTRIAGVNAEDVSFFDVDYDGSVNVVTRSISRSNIVYLRVEEEGQREIQKLLFDPIDVSKTISGTEIHCSSFSIFFRSNYPGLILNNVVETDGCSASITEEGQSYIYMSNMSFIKGTSSSKEASVIYETTSGNGIQVDISVVYDSEKETIESTVIVTSSSVDFPISLSGYYFYLKPNVWYSINVRTTAPMFTFGTRKINPPDRGDYSVVEGVDNVASGGASHAEGSNNVASGGVSHAEGYDTIASGSSSHAEGNNTLASGEASHAEGYNSEASGDFSHAEGGGEDWSRGGRASGGASHAEGIDTEASGLGSHAEGGGTAAMGRFSHAEGGGHPGGYSQIPQGGTASGDYSHIQNETTTANKRAQTALGSYNQSDTSTTTTHPSGDTAYGTYAVMIGNGYYDESNESETKSNALSVKWNGDIELPRVEIKGRSDFVIDLFDANKQPIYKWYMSSYGSLARQQYSNGSWGAAKYYLVRDDIHNLFSCNSISQTIGSVAAGSTKTLTFSAAKTGYDPIAISGWYMNGAAGLYPYMLRLNGSDIQCYVRNPTSSASSSTAKVEVQVLYCRSSW